jgi:hypothetical protein
VVPQSVTTVGVRNVTERLAGGSLVNSRPRHARKKDPRRAQLLFRAGLTVAVTGAVVGGAGGTAFAAQPNGPGGGAPKPGAQLDSAGDMLNGALRHASGATVQGLGKGVVGVLGPAKNLQLDPLAKTGADPLSNAVGTQIADFKPITTEPLTGPLANGASLTGVPLLGGVFRSLPG